MQAAATDPDSTVTATHDVGQDLDAAVQKANCIIDFTVHSFTAQVVEAALKHGTRLVIGTTGHSDEEREMIRKAAEKLPIVFASNYSVGVNLVFKLLEQAAKVMGDYTDIEIIKPGIVDPFTAPLVPIERISGFRASFDPLHLRRITGVLTYIDPGSFLYLQHGNRGVRVQTRQGDDFALGSVIEAAGFIATQHYYAEMEEALLRVKSPGTPPPPVPATFIVRLPVMA
jgi:hypothetical protein